MLGLRPDWDWFQLDFDGEDLPPQWRTCHLTFIMTPYRERYANGAWEGWLPRRGWPVTDTPISVFEHDRVYSVLEYAIFRMQVLDDRLPGCFVLWGWSAGSDHEWIRDRCRFSARRRQQ